MKTILSKINQNEIHQDMIVHAFQIHVERCSPTQR